VTEEKRARQRAAQAKAARLIRLTAAALAGLLGLIREGPPGLLLGLLAFWLFSLLGPPPED